MTNFAPALSDRPMLWKTYLGSSPLTSSEMCEPWREVEGGGFVLAFQFILRTQAKVREFTDMLPWLAGFTLNAVQWVDRSRLSRQDHNHDHWWPLPAPEASVMAWIPWIFYFCFHSLWSSMSQNLTLPCNDGDQQNCPAQCEKSQNGTVCISKHHTYKDSSF